MENADMEYYQRKEAGQVKKLREEKFKKREDLKGLQVSK